MARALNRFDEVHNNLDRMKLIENYIKMGVNLTKDITEEMLELNKELSDEVLESCNNVMIEFLLLDSTKNNFIQAVKSVEQQYANVEDLPKDLDKILNETFLKLPLPSTEDLKNNEQYKDYEMTVSELRSPGTLGNQCVVTVHEDEEMTVTEFQQIPLDPLTKQEINNPMKNKRCGHSYERDSILNYLRGRRVRCPMVGCNNREPIAIADLEENHQLKRLIERIRKGKR